VSAAGWRPNVEPHSLIGHAIVRKPHPPHFLEAAIAAPPTALTADAPAYDIYINGRFYEPERARVPVGDAGFQHAVGLFETVQVWGGRVFRLDDHLRRLARSAGELGLIDQLDPGPLADAVRQTVDHNRLDRARLRLTLTAGSLSLLRADEGETPEIRVQRTVTIVPTEPTHYDPKFYTDGVTVLIHGPAANPFDDAAGHKTLNYWTRLRSLRRAAAAGASEAIWLNITNHLASGAVSNLFLVKDGVLETPFARGEEVAGALAAPVLPGITRSVVLELAERQGLSVRRKMLTVQEMLDADEVFLTNSGWGVLPVTRVEQRSIGDGRPGPLTTQLRTELEKLRQSES
jgi:branched-subunit amino acid aminotransferase/4-amino-4-deoxychorismate lyase